MNKWFLFEIQTANLFSVYKYLKRSKVRIPEEAAVSSRFDGSRIVTVICILSPLYLHGTEALNQGVVLFKLRTLVLGKQGVDHSLV